MDLRVICVTPKMPPGCPRPLLVGHSTHRTVNETSLIVGGGCTCFSFGSYWNSGAWTLYFREQGIMAPWALCKPKPPVSTKQKGLLLTYTKGIQGAPAEPVQVASTTIATSGDLSILISNSTDSQPIIIKDLDLGPCTQLWTPAYFKSRTSATRKAIIHSAPTSIMNFTRRDTFTYNTLPFHGFLNIISSDSPDMQPHMYLRSISSDSPNSKPANLETDWPEIASDFRLAPQLFYIKERMHSSPLRISTNLSMWLHYDVMANILFHISSYSHVNSEEANPLPT